MLDTRTVTIQTREAHALFRFVPEFSGGAGELLLKKDRYAVTTDADGTGLIELPCSETGILWTCLPPSDYGSQEFQFTLQSGDESVSLDELFVAGLILPSGDAVYAYIDARINEILDRRATSGQFGLARVDGTTILSDNGLISINPALL